LRGNISASGAAILEFERRRLLPLFITQEAIALLEGHQWEEAIERLCEALKIDPLWPCYDFQDFADFYKYRNAWEIAVILETDAPAELEIPEGLLADVAKNAEKRAWLEIPPNMRYLLDWLYQAPDDVQDLDKKIENWFGKLTAAHPSNCFILLYWADAIKVVPRLKNKDQEGTLPLHILNKAIKKCEEAQKLCPALPIIPIRLFGLYSSTLQYFSENTPEYKHRLGKAIHYLGQGKLHLTETIPELQQKLEQSPSESNNSPA
jgi:hypothetical protein